MLFSDFFIPELLNSSDSLSDFICGSLRHITYTDTQRWSIPFHGRLMRLLRLYQSFLRYTCNSHCRYNDMLCNPHGSPGWVFP